MTTASLSRLFRIFPFLKGIKSSCFSSGKTDRVDTDFKKCNVLQIAAHTVDQTRNISLAQITIEAIKSYTKVKESMFKTVECVESADGKKIYKCGNNPSFNKDLLSTAKLYAKELLEKSEALVPIFTKWDENKEILSKTLILSLDKAEQKALEKMPESIKSLEKLCSALKDFDNIDETIDYYGGKLEKPKAKIFGVAEENANDIEDNKTRSLNSMSKKILKQFNEESSRVESVLECGTSTYGYQESFERILGVIQGEHKTPKV